MGICIIGSCQIKGLIPRGLKKLKSLYGHHKIKNYLRCKNRG
jgi:hypothetical protein